MTSAILVLNKKVLSAARIDVTEFDRGAIEFRALTHKGWVTVTADVHRFQNVLVFDELHVFGEGLNIGTVRRLAKVFGQVEDVDEVIIQGGQRSSGANKGSVPTTIRVKVK